MAILSFRKLVSSIFIILSVAGLLFSVFELMAKPTVAVDAIPKIIVFSLIFAASYYIGYIYRPVAKCSSGTTHPSGATHPTGATHTTDMQHASTLSSEASVSTTSPGTYGVFNISENIYKYDQAEQACKNKGATLATRAQVEEAQAGGQNWCNYGWTEGGEALFPVQKSAYDMTQSLPEGNKCRNVCGSGPGVMGGKGMDPRNTLGVNCYGQLPKDSIKKKWTMPQSCMNAGSDWSSPTGALDIESTVYE